MVRYEMSFLTDAQKLTLVSLMYRMEAKTKKVKNKKSF